jgi:hypothetical protein
MVLVLRGRDFLSDAPLFIGRRDEFEDLLGAGRASVRAGLPLDAKYPLLELFCGSPQRGLRAEVPADRTVSGTLRAPASVQMRWDASRIPYRAQRSRPRSLLTSL